MDTDRTTIPGTGVLHSFRTRGGIRFALLTESSGARHLFAYEAGGDEPVVDIGLEPDEADQLADLLHSDSIPDRLARVEQRLDELTARLEGDAPCAQAT
ncbi:hypothetical protein ACFVVM_11300 [Nocardia sp. NPDC058176]|uniref:hypothetical protein n=1 Tax=Nocardia sp. NPDC058176 TaxID=3346368 RepID=UPI0036DD0A4F